jgi:CRP/FNR family transcriptional regulator, cyclic AMP receptor protein
MKQNILLIEDNAPLRENTVELLEFYNYKVLIACNGQEGIEMAIAQIPDLILSDIMMPVMDGYHLLELIRQQPFLNHSRFIFFTASSEKKEIEMGMKLGADDYIVKPFTENELLDKLKKALG